MSIRFPLAQSFYSLGKSAAWTSSANRRTFLPFSGICFAANFLRAGVRLRKHFLFPPNGHQLLRKQPRETDKQTEACLQIVVVSPFLDRRHGTERCIIEQIERLSSKYGWGLHLFFL